MVDRKNISRQGFTLVEMAIVLVIVGLLVGLGSSMIGPLTNMAKLRETREIIDSDMTSVIGWAASNNRLPDVAAFQASTKRTTDSWTRPLIYLYDNNLNTPATKDTICGRRSTQISLQTMDPAATINNVAFVIISQGEDPSTAAPGLFTTLDGAAVTTATSASLTTPPNPRAIVVPAGTDDIVRWVTLDELRSKMGCQGAQLKILNNELPYGSVASAYTTVITADGGVPFAVNPDTYKWCVSTLPAGFVQTGGVVNANCSTLNESGWAAASLNLTISFPSSVTSTGSYQLAVTARDSADGVTTSNSCNNVNPGDNCAQKTFVITVNP